MKQLVKGWNNIPALGKVLSLILLAVEVATILWGVITGQYIITVVFVVIIGIIDYFMIDEILEHGK